MKLNCTFMNFEVKYNFENVDQENTQEYNLCFLGVIEI